MTLPVLGAALPIGELKRHRDWLAEADRPLELQDFLFPQVLDADWRSLVALARGALEGWRGPLGIHGPFFDLVLEARDPEARALVRRRMLQGLEVCEALGADLMVVHSPFTSWGVQNDFLTGGRGPIVERTAETLAPVLARAEDAGVTLAVENVEDPDAADRAALVDAIGSPALAVSLDTGHAHYAHVSRGGRPVDWHVIGAGARLRHVHVQDADGYADRHWPPGMGTVPWRPVFEAIAEHAPGARCVLELKDPARTREGAAFLAAAGLAT